jgi:hypothetical protein
MIGIILIIIALAILIMANDSKVLYTENKTGICHEYIGKGKASNGTYHILRSTKDAGFILVLEEELKERFHK